MPRTKGKYDLPAYQTILTNVQRKQRNAFFFLERLKEIDPEFSQNFTEIARRKATGEISGKEAGEKIWAEMQKAIKKH